MSVFIHLQSISELFKFFKLEDKVLHPQIAVVDFSRSNQTVTEETKISTDFYALIFKNYNRNNAKYGRRIIDFHDGSLICMAPNQVLEMDTDIDYSDNMMGWGVFFHPDLIRPTSLYKKINDYSFFSYEISEALHLSEKEKNILYECVLKIEGELKENIDIHSQHIIVSAVELLLNYCSRFYGRQFITRKSSNSTILAQVEQLLKDYFKTTRSNEDGLPTVKYLADRVNLSSSYLSDLLKKETGKNTQDHIHYHLIEEAKYILLNTDQTIGEIAFTLGFEYPQYFNKLFKQKTGKTPIEFRNMN